MKRMIRLQRCTLITINKNMQPFIIIKFHVALICLTNVSDNQRRIFILRDSQSNQQTRWEVEFGHPDVKYLIRAGVRRNLRC